MASIVTYDIPSKHAELKQELFDLGYQVQIPGTNCKVIYFPNTTVYHETKTPLEAREDLRSTCIKLKINLERSVATSWTGWAAFCGEPFK